MSSSRENRVYVGNLPPDIRTRDIEDMFYKYGKISYIELKNKRGPPFAFIEFEDPRDAEDAIRWRDGYGYDGYTLRVEYPRGNGASGGGRGYGGFRQSRGGFSDRGGGGRGGPPSRRTQYRVLVSGLPPSGSWQDLKDHMREAGDVCYADVYKDGTGVVEFMREKDMLFAVKNLDDTKFRSHEAEIAYIRVKEDTGSGGGGGGGGGSSRSRSRSRSRSPKRATRGSPRYSPVRDRERSYSPYK